MYVAEGSVPWVPFRFSFFFGGCVAMEKVYCYRVIEACSDNPCWKTEFFLWLLGYCSGFRIFSGACRDERSLLEK